MPRKRDIVLADDLTGAAEVAGVAHRLGQRTVLITGRTTPTAGRVVVIDTDSRLLSASAASVRLRRFGRAAGRRLLFKKTDSVLRGPVRAELDALAGDFARVLLVPANPQLGRTIRDGVYRVNGRRLDRTAFACDPHHPARSARVEKLLGKGAGKLHVLPSHAPAPTTGLVLGEASRAADLDRWARTVDDRTLPGGGAEFFAAVLRARGARLGGATRPAAPAGPVLVISGSLAAQARAAARAARRAGWVVSHRREDLARALADRGGAWCATALSPRKSPAAVRRHLAVTIAALHRARAFSHLVIEGGATAAAIIRALGWRRFAVLGEWAPGVVALRPDRTRNIVLTLKPGSYAWPATLRAAIRRVHRARPHA